MKQGRSGFNLFVAIFFVMLGLCATTPSIHAQDYPNTITFDNKSGELALVKLIGPTGQSIEVPNGESRTVNATAGEYYILTRYGSRPRGYKYAKGDPFTVVQTESEYSIITITLHPVIGGNYATYPISAAEFEKGPVTRESLFTPHIQPTPNRQPLPEARTPETKVPLQQMQTLPEIRVPSAKLENETHPLLKTERPPVSSSLREEELKFSIVAQEQKDDLWWFFVLLKNLSDKEVSINLSPTIVDSKGDEHKPTIMFDADPFEGYLSKGSWFLKMMIPEGLILTFDANHHLKGTSLPPTKAVIIPLSFQLPAGIKPARIDLNQEGLTTDLSKIPVLPLLPAPKVKIRDQPPGIDIGIGEVAIVIGKAKRANSDSSQDGLVRAIVLLGGGGGFDINFITEFTTYPSDVWLLASVSFKNMGQSAIDVPLNRFVIVPRLPEKGGEENAPVGMGTEKQFYLGSPFARNIIIEAGATKTVVLVYRPKPELWWVDEYALSWR